MTLENFEGIEGNEALRNKLQDIHDHLVAAFGGKSQVPDYVFGQAIAGQINNSSLGQIVEGVAPKVIFEAAGEVINKYWEDQEGASAHIDEIAQGYNEQMKHLGLQ